MKKRFYGTAGAIAALAFAGSAFATQIDVNTAADGSGGNGEPTLYQVAHTAGFTNVTAASPQSNDAYWTFGATNSSSSLLVATWTSNFNQATFGVYDPNDSTNRLSLLGAGSQLGANTNETTGYLKYSSSTGLMSSYYTDSGSVQHNLHTADFGGDVFGYFLTIGGNTYYSDTTLNSGADRMVGYQGSSGTKGLMNEYLFGWEDGTDRDYQDYVATVESIRPVPEPSSIAMFGVGLLMIGFAARRIQKRDV